MEYVQEGSSRIPDWKFKDKPNPDHAVALSDLGFAKLQAGDVTGARQYFEQALRIDPENPHALINMGIIHEENGDTARAIEMYEKVLARPVGEDVDEPRSSKDVPLRDVARQNLEQLQGGNDVPAPEKDGE
jgi:general secretion pathway protein D